MSDIIDTLDDTIGLIDLCLLAVKSINVEFGEAQKGLSLTLTIATENLTIAKSKLYEVQQ